MGCMLRSDPMTMVDLYIQPETAFDLLAELGELGCMEFMDMNPHATAFQRQYVSEVCRLAEMERKLRYIEGELTKDSIYIPNLPSTDLPGALPLHEMGPMETLVEKWANDISEIATNQMTLMKDFCTLQEYYYVVTNLETMLGNSDLNTDLAFNKMKGQSAQLESGLGGRIIVKTGVVHRSKCYPFETMLWRLSRGNIVYNMAEDDKPLDDPYTGQEIRKVAFMVVCHGEQLSACVDKVCAGFRANMYPCPTTVAERDKIINNLEWRIQDLEQVLSQTLYLRCKALRSVGRNFIKWYVQVKKAKSIYHVMNLFSHDFSRKCFVARAWIPTSDIPAVTDILTNISVKAGATVHSFMLENPTDQVPPTYHRTNKFTHGFQALINAYGDSTYQELNPALYTIITFPFLFSLMFGDVCHGLIMVICATFMVYREKKFMANPIENEIMKIFFEGRYVILLMGSFSVFSGSIFNEYFSISMPYTSSAWQNPYTVEGLSNTPTAVLDPHQHYWRPFVYGMDPIWALSENRILFENSVKMKMSIIVGVVHMIFGLTLSLGNFCYFKQRYKIFLEFIPQFLFLVCLFFWLVILIFYKWFLYSGLSDDPKRNQACAPLILIHFIDMMLFSTTKPVGDICDAYMFPHQQTVQTVLVLVAVSCVPIMLLGSPIYLLMKNRKKVAQAKKNLKAFKKNSIHFLGKTKSDMVMAVEEAKFHMSDHMIHQAVHTIEFVLSTISHTASYLRLWALSLAHSQLSEMLWHMVFSKLALHDYSYMGALRIFCIFFVWASFSLSILVVMEGMSAFLHTLRLHWVEFMSKFYGGTGYSFRPFSFKAVLERTKDDKADAICTTKRTRGE